MNKYGSHLRPFSHKLFWLYLILTLQLAAPPVGVKAKKIYEPPAQCDNVCSFGELNDLINATHRRRNTNIVSINITNGNCEKIKYSSWSDSARRFMKYLNMSDSTFGCPREHLVERPTLAQRRFRTTRLHLLVNSRDNAEHVKFNYSRVGNENVIKRPSQVPGRCFIVANRGVMYKVPNGEFATDWISSEIHKQETAPIKVGFAFVLINERTRKIRSIRVPHDSNDTCIGRRCDSSKLLWLPITTFNTSVEEKSTRSKLAVYSMFARFSIEQVPGMSGLLENLKEGVRLMENVNNDLSWSNLAILCLPLLMAIPPVSLLETVSNKVTVWYAFATDFLAALPLMIKGIELIVVYRQATPSMYSTLSMVGKKHGIFETWYSHCQPPPGKLGWAGTMMVVASVWLVLASSYVEFLFWRLARYKQGVMKKTDDEERLAIAEDLPSSMMERDIREQPNNRSRLAPHSAALIFFSISFFLAMTGMFLVEIMPSVQPTMYGLLTIDIVVSLLFVILRSFAMHRQTQFLSWSYVSGFALGCIGGPIYLLLHTFETVRNSDKWANASDGAAVGFATMVMILKFLLKPELYAHYSKHRYVAGSLVFVSVLTISSAITHVLRSSGKDKTLWWYTGNGFTLGFLFGPFSILLRNCFPVLHAEKDNVRRHFLQGMYFGMVLICMVVANVTRVVSPLILHPEPMYAYNPNNWI